jgi:hypothetical protein
MLHKRRRSDPRDRHATEHHGENLDTSVGMVPDLDDSISMIRISEPKDLFGLVASTVGLGFEASYLWIRETFSDARTHLLLKKNLLDSGRESVNYSVAASNGNDAVARRGEAAVFKLVILFLVVFLVIVMMFK